MHPLDQVIPFDVFDQEISRLNTLLDTFGIAIPDGANILINKARSARHGRGCQSAYKFDPVSASNFDPFARRDLRVALDSSELAGIAETRRARAA